MVKDGIGDEQKEMLSGLSKVYFFTPDDRREDILMMLSTYGVEIIENQLSNEKGKYKKYYHETIDELKEYMAG